MLSAIEVGTLILLVVLTTPVPLLLEPFHFSTSLEDLVMWSILRCAVVSATYGYGSRRCVYRYVLRHPLIRACAQPVRYE
jgi:hypothetical protein